MDTNTAADAPQSETDKQKAYQYIKHSTEHNRFQTKLNKNKSNNINLCL